jgi:hypothetical protein
VSPSLTSYSFNSLLSDRAFPFNSHDWASGAGAVDSCIDSRDFRDAMVAVGEAEMENVRAGFRDLMVMLISLVEEVPWTSSSSGSGRFERGT